MKDKLARKNNGGGGILSASPIARAVSELETEKANLMARVEKVDQAIASLRALFHLPTNGRAAAPATPAPRAKSDTTTAAIRAALSNGPLSPGALATAVGIERPVLRIHVKRLEADGAIVSSGTTASRRIALAGRPAKEAP